MKCGSYQNHVQCGDTTNWGSGDPGQYLLCDLASPCPSLGLTLLTCSEGVIQTILIMIHGSKQLMSWTRTKGLGWKEWALVPTLCPLVVAFGSVVVKSNRAPSWGGQEAGVVVSKE